MTRARNAARAATGTVQKHAHRTFSSLKVRNYRLYFIGQTISLLGTWMQMLAVGWLIWRMTKNPFLLGLVKEGSGVGANVLKNLSASVKRFAYAQ